MRNVSFFLFFSAPATCNCRRGDHSVPTDSDYMTTANSRETWLDIDYKLYRNACNAIIIPSGLRVSVFIRFITSHGLPKS